MIRPCLVLVTDSWTSGTPLLRPDWKELLSYGYDKLGYDSITLCGYGIGDTPVPFRGVISAKETEEVISRIHSWNQGELVPLKINLTLTIHRGNCDFASLEKMIKASIAMQVDKIRFNCFVNYRSLPSLRSHELNHPIIIDRFYGDLAELFRRYRDWRQALYGCWGGIGVTDGFNNPRVSQMIFS